MFFTLIHDISQGEIHFRFDTLLNLPERPLAVV